MTKEEFLRRGGEIRYGARPYDRAHALALWALALLGVLALKYLAEEFIFIYTAFLLLVSISYMVWSARKDRQTGLLCHSCDKPIVRRAATLAIDSGVCPHCQKQAFGVAV